MSKQKFYDYRLLLLRHGQTEANRGGCFLGRLDQPLTPVGKAQAQNLGRLLADEDLDVIYTSPWPGHRPPLRPWQMPKGLNPS